MTRRVVSSLLSSRWASLAVLVTGLICTVLVVSQLRRAATERDEQRFENTVNRVEDSINQRMEGYYALLRATAGLISGEEGQTTPQGFEAFISQMRLDQYYEGVVGIGYSARLPQFLVNLRQKVYPTLAMTAKDSSAEWHAIVLIAPMTPHNVKVIGLDMFRDLVRGVAMDNARSDAMASASGRVVLAQNDAGDPTPGFLIYQPVYSTYTDLPKDNEDRKERLVGFTYGAFRTDELFTSMFSPTLTENVVFTIYDGSTTNEESVLFRSESRSSSTHSSLFNYTESIGVAGRRWTIVARSTPAFEAAPTQNLAAMAAVAGLLLTLALTGLTSLQTRARIAAETDRHAAARAEEAARTAAERLELVLKGARVGLWYSTLPFETLQWDERVKAHFFFPPDENEITVERAFERVHPDDREGIRAAMGWSIREHAPFDVEYRTISPDGLRMNWIRSIGQTFVDVHGKPIRFDVLTIDVTTLKQGQESLAESEAKFRQLANSIPQLAWIARPDGYLFWYNQRWYDYTGTTPSQMEGWGWTDVHHRQYLPEVSARWRTAIATGEPLEIEFPIRAADGHYGWFLTQVVPLRDVSGNVLFWFGTCTDLTEKRKLSQEREQLLESERAARGIAERASQLKDEFLATLSHELRTPLNAILGWAQILRRQHAGVPDLAEGLGIIERNARVQTQLVSDLLDMSRVISGKLRLEVQVVDPATVVAAAAEGVKPAADAKEISLIAEFEPNAGPIHADPARLQQIVWNLLSNAIKFTPRGGKVRMMLSRVNDRVVFGVVDTGEGVKPEFLPHLFERFRQADGSITRRHGGLGLGLAIVKNLVELHGGRVWASSDGLGQGAGFFVEFPVLAGNPDMDAGDIADNSALQDVGVAAAIDSLDGLRVLVIDDEPDARELIRRVLSEAGATVLVANGGRQAMGLLRQERPDVILSDIGMPDQDGYQFIRAVRQLRPEEGGTTPAAALTAFARSEDRRRALIAGYQSHIAKPVESAELVTVVAALAGRAGKTAELIS